MTHAKPAKVAHLSLLCSLAAELLARLLAGPLWALLEWCCSSPRADRQLLGPRAAWQTGRPTGEPLRPVVALAGASGL